jgi:hypothetical protein
MAVLGRVEVIILHGSAFGLALFLFKIPGNPTLIGFKPYLSGRKNIIKTMG